MPQNFPLCMYVLRSLSKKKGAKQKALLHFLFHKQGEEARLSLRLSLFNVGWHTCLSRERAQVTLRKEMILLHPSSFLGGSKKELTFITLDLYQGQHVEVFFP